MINEIRRRLESGETIELECNERHHFLNVNEGAAFDENLEILESSLVVEMVGVNNIYILGCSHPIMIDEIQYFKIKDQEPTFDDLIDVVVQAYRDGHVDRFIVGYDVGIERIRIQVDTDYHTLSISGDVEENIEFIKSLYTETFVIESEEDIKRVKIGAKITLSNGSEFVAELVTQLSRGWVIDSTIDGIYQTYILFVLKGATVTQKRGSHD